MVITIPATAGVYEIRNLVNGKRYIGSAANLRLRLWQHQDALRKGTHRSTLLLKAAIKHGIGNLRFAVIEIVDDPLFLRAREQAWMRRVKPEYNMNDDAWTPIEAGSKKPREWVARGRAALMKRYAAGWVNPLKGRKLTPEQRASFKAKLAASCRKSRKGVPFSVEAATNIAAAARLIHEERRAAGVPGLAKGYRCTPEQIENRRRAGRLGAAARYGAKP